MSRVVDAYFYDLQGAHQRLALEIRSTILETLPGVVESMKYKIPFYSCPRNICYLNSSKSELIVGFVRGKDLPDPEGVLTASDRQQIRHLKFKLDEPYDPQWLKFFLLEAAAISRAR